MSKSNRTTTKLEDDVILYKTKVEDPLHYKYEAECTSFNVVNLTLDFKGSSNYVVQDAAGNKLNDLKLVTQIRPFSKSFLGSVVLVDKYKASVLKLAMSWIKEEPNEEETQSYLFANSIKISQAIQDAQALNFPDNRIDTDNKIALTLCADNRIPFVDPDFPPSENALYKSTSGSASGDQSGNGNKTAIEWKRADEFMDGPYEVFSGAIEPNDIRQGALGDCWFLCAISAIAEFPPLVHDLFPPESSLVNEAGVYTVKFCKNGLWRTVRVDDFFPCYPGAGPIYSKSHGNELWVLLMEKAFAKLCGSYEAIKAGYAYEAMMDLTGAPYKSFRFEDADVQQKIQSGSLWQYLVDYDKQNFVMSASTPGEDVYTETGKRPGKEVTTGLVGGHAYTLIKVHTTKYKNKLVKLRNPWGQMEWTGDWSDTSSKWTDELKRDADPEGFQVANDGMFWMSFEDMLHYFVSINVCMVRHPGLNAHPWVEERRKFYYSYNEHAPNSNGSKTSSPAYKMILDHHGTFMFSVHQEDIRCAGAKPYIDVGVTVMKIESDGSYTVVVSSGNAVERQNQTEEMEFQAGEYLVVPTTSGCKLKAYLESDAGKGQGSEVDWTKTSTNGETTFSSRLCDVLEEIHSRIDMDGDKILDLNEFNQFLIQAEEEPFNDNVYEFLLSQFNDGETRGFTSSGFIKAHKYLFDQNGLEKLKKSVYAMGYDDNLRFNHGRGAVVAVHGTANYSFTTIPFDESTYCKALDLPVLSQGTFKQMKYGAKFYELKGGYFGISYAVENTDSHHALSFKLDCSASQNLVSHRGQLNHTEIVPPKQYCVLHHLVPLDESLGWSLGYSMSYGQV
eukprot:gene6609-9076_t